MGIAESSMWKLWVSIGEAKMKLLATDKNGKPPTNWNCLKSHSNSMPLQLNLFHGIPQPSTNKDAIIDTMASVTALYLNQRTMTLIDWCHVTKSDESCDVLA